MPPLHRSRRPRGKPARPAPPRRDGRGPYRASGRGPARGEPLGVGTRGVRVLARPTRHQARPPKGRRCTRGRQRGRRRDPGPAGHSMQRAAPARGRRGPPLGRLRAPPRSGPVCAEQPSRRGAELAEHQTCHRLRFVESVRRRVGRERGEESLASGVPGHAAPRADKDKLAEPPGARAGPGPVLRLPAAIKKRPSRRTSRTVGQQWSSVREATTDTILSPAIRRAPETPGRQACPVGGAGRRGRCILSPCHRRSSAGRGERDGGEERGRNRRGDELVCRHDSSSS